MQAEKPGYQLVHKGHIVGMHLGEAGQRQEDLKLYSVCSRGILAEWDIKDMELLNVTKLEVGSAKVKFCEIRENQAILFSSEAKQFRVFDIQVGKVTRQFSALTASHAVTSIAASSDAKLLAYT